jgi:hypothetical protein
VLDEREDVGGPEENESSERSGPLKRDCCDPCSGEEVESNSGGADKGCSRGGVWRGNGEGEVGPNVKGGVLEETGGKFHGEV